MKLMSHDCHLFHANSSPNFQFQQVSGCLQDLSTSNSWSAMAEYLLVVPESLKNTVKLRNFPKSSGRLSKFPFEPGNPYNGYINPYYWVDDHPLLYGNNGSLDPIAHFILDTIFVILEWTEPPSVCPSSICRIFIQVSPLHKTEFSMSVINGRSSRKGLAGCRWIRRESDG